MRSTGLFCGTGATFLSPKAKFWPVSGLIMATKSLEYCSKIKTSVQCISLPGAKNKPMLSFSFGIVLAHAKMRRTHSSTALSFILTDLVACTKSAPFLDVESSHQHSYPVAASQHGPLNNNVPMLLSMRRQILDLKRATLIMQTNCQ